MNLIEFLQAYHITWSDAALILAVAHLYKLSLNCQRKHELLLKRLAEKGCIQRDCPKNKDKWPPSGAASITPVLRNTDRY